MKSSKVKCPKIISKVFGIGGEISYKNLQRSRKKYRTTVVSITLCVAVFIALSYFMNLVFGVLNLEFRQTEYNLSLTYREEEGMNDYVTAVRNLENTNKITAMSAIGYNLSEYTFSEEFKKFYDEIGMEEEESYSLVTYVLDETSYKEYLRERNLDYEEMKDKAVLLNTIYVDVYDEEKEKTVETQMKQFAMKKGDKVTGYVHLLNEDAMKVENKVEMEIGAVVKEPPMGIDKISVIAQLVVGESFADKMLGKEHYNYIYIDAEDAEQTQKEIEGLIDAADEEKIDINNVNEIVRVMKSFYTLIGIFLYGFITVIALIGITNIFNTITTNMKLRRREFAMLRSIGMTSKEFNRMIQLESFFYGMKSLLIGIPVGCALSYVMHQVMSQSDVQLKYQLPLGAIVISAFAVFVLITVIMKYSIGRIQKQNMIETIRNENI